MDEQWVRAKSLEIAVLMQGEEDESTLMLSHQIGGLVHRYSGLAAEIEKYIRQQPPFQKQ